MASVARVARVARVAIVVSKALQDKAFGCFEAFICRVTFAYYGVQGVIVAGVGSSKGF